VLDHPSAPDIARQAVKHDNRPDLCKTPRSAPTCTDTEKNRDKFDAIAEAESLFPDTGFEEGKVHSCLVPIKSRYRLLTLDLVIESKAEQTETVHIAASASEVLAGKPKVVNIAAPGAAGGVVPFGSWVKDVNSKAYYQVTSQSSVVKRTASGTEPVSFIAVNSEGGRTSYLYSNENKDWERSDFAHGSKYVIPLGDGAFGLRPEYNDGEIIRKEFYGDDDAHRRGIVKRRLLGLLNPQDDKFFLSEGDPSQEASKGYIQRMNGKAVVPITEASPDHDPPIANHWTSQGGNNIVQATRVPWNDSDNTYKIISYSLNINLGSRGARYTNLVGPNFRGTGE
jgi:hypothetical protein